MKQGKTIVGIVLSNKMDKTIVVAVEHRFSHPHYHKVITRTTKLYAHDEDQIAQVGDTVSLAACHPLSRLKRWRVLRVVEKDVQSPAMGSESSSSPLNGEAK
jgi:small subunit ribosomal protein S17